MNREFTNRYEFLNICLQNQIEIDLEFGSPFITLVKRVKGWDNKTRLIRVFMEIDNTQYTEVVSMAIHVLNKECERAIIPDKETVMREWITAKQLGQRLNIPYSRTIKQLRLGRLAMATQIKNRWYCSPQE